MSRLRKIALGGDIKKSDIGFAYYDNHESVDIVMTLTNYDKAKHDLSEDWDGEFFNAKGSGKVIGFMRYGIVKDTKERVEIYVNFLETRKEYRKTRVVRYLLDEFKERVLDEAINKVGKENVYISADVINNDLENFLERVTKKLGINFKQMNDLFGENDLDQHDIEEMTESEKNYLLLTSGLEEAGFTVKPYELAVVENANIKEYIDFVTSFSLDDDSKIEVSELHGAIDNGNIEYTCDIASKGFYAMGGMDYYFIYDVASLKLLIGAFTDDFIQYKDIKLTIDNMKQVLPSGTLIEFVDNDEPLTIDSLGDKAYEIL